MHVDAWGDMRHGGRVGVEISWDRTEVYQVSEDRATVTMLGKEGATGFRGSQCREQTTKE